MKQWNNGVNILKHLEQQILDFHVWKCIDTYRCIGAAFNCIILFALSTGIGTNTRFQPPLHSLHFLIPLNWECVFLMYVLSTSQLLHPTLFIPASLPAPVPALYSINAGMLIAFIPIFMRWWQIFGRNFSPPTLTFSLSAIKHAGISTALVPVLHWEGGRPEGGGICRLCKRVRKRLGKMISIACLRGVYMLLGI